MDFAFLNAVIRAEHFPPEDPWLAGHPISYYYFGHFIMATLTKLTTSAPAVGYNIALALIPALVAAASFGLVYNLIRLSGGSRGAGLGYGLLAPVLVVVIGNLEGMLELAHNQGWGGSVFWQWVGHQGTGRRGPDRCGAQYRSIVDSRRDRGRFLRSGLCPDPPFRPR